VDYLGEGIRSTSTVSPEGCQQRGELVRIFHPTPFPACTLSMRLAAGKFTQLPAVLALLHRHVFRAPWSSLPRVADTWVFCTVSRPAIILSTSRRCAGR